MLAFRRVFLGGFGVGFGGCRRCGKNLFPGLGLGSSCSWGHLSAADGTDAIATVDTMFEPNLWRPEQSFEIFTKSSETPQGSSSCGFDAEPQITCTLFELR